MCKAGKVKLQKEKANWIWEEFQGKNRIWNRGVFTCCLANTETLQLQTEERRDGSGSGKPRPFATLSARTIATSKRQFYTTCSLIPMCSVYMWMPTYSCSIKHHWAGFNFGRFILLSLMALIIPQSKKYQVFFKKLPWLKFVAVIHWMWK